MGRWFRWPVAIATLFVLVAAVPLARAQQGELCNPLIPHYQQPGCIDPEEEAPGSEPSRWEEPASAAPAAPEDAEAPMGLGLSEPAPAAEISTALDEFDITGLPPVPTSFEEQRIFQALDDTETVAGAALAHRLLGRYHLAHGRPDHAVIEFAKAVALDPGDVWSMVRIGEAWEALGEREEAAAAYLAALAVDRTSYAAVTRLRALGVEVAWGAEVGDEEDSPWAGWTADWQIYLSDPDRAAASAPEGLAALNQRMRWLRQSDLYRQLPFVAGG